MNEIEVVCIYVKRWQLYRDDVVANDEWESCLETSARVRRSSPNDCSETDVSEPPSGDTAG